MAQSDNADKGGNAWVGARNPQALARCGITSKLDTVERGLSYLYHKQIALRLAREGEDKRGDIIRDVEETYIRPAFTRAMKREGVDVPPKETWQMLAPVAKEGETPKITGTAVADLKHWLAREHQYISSGNTEALRTRYQIGNTPNVVDLALARLFREQVDNYMTELGARAPACYLVKETICRRGRNQVGNDSWQVLPAGIPLLKEMLARPSPWIMSNQDQRLLAHGITNRADVLEAHLPSYFEHLVAEEQAESEVREGKPLCEALARQRVESTKLRRVGADEIRFAQSGWAINEDFADQLAREVPQVRSHGVQDWVSVSRKSYRIRDTFPELNQTRGPELLTALQGLAADFYNQQITCLRRKTHQDDEFCMDEVERTRIFHDQDYQEPVWRIHRDAMADFRAFVQKQQPELLQGASRQVE